MDASSLGVTLLGDGVSFQLPNGISQRGLFHGVSLGGVLLRLGALVGCGRVGLLQLGQARQVVLQLADRGDHSFLSGGQLQERCGNVGGLDAEGRCLCLDLPHRGLLGFEGAGDLGRGSGRRR